MKYICKECKARSCTVELENSNEIPLKCLFFLAKSKWTPIDLPKLTVEVFNREDCPEWGRYATVDENGIAFFHEKKPMPHHLSEGRGCWRSPELKGYSRQIDDTIFDSFCWATSLIERPKKHKQLPDWVTVGAPYYDGSNYVFKTFTEHDLEDTDELKQLIEFGIYREVRCEVLATDKLEALIGKVLQHKNGYKALVCSYDAKTNLVYMGHYTVTPEVLKTSWTMDGKPCCKMLYWSHRSGTWIEPC